MAPTSDQHLKSISLRLDLAEPERFSHYHPTSNSLRVMRAVYAGEPNQASIVVAAYGSGKSLATGAALLLARNDPKARKVLRQAAARISPEHRAERQRMEERLGSNQRGLALALEGYCGDLPAALHAAAKPQLPQLRRNQHLLRLLESILEHARQRKLAPVAIVWDEFGRHIEELARRGHLEAMHEVQRLAEWVARQQEPRVTLTLLLHQNFVNYAGGASQSAGSGLRKIEGRFESIRFVEDSKEIHQLIASLIDGRHGLLVKPTLRAMQAQAKRLHKLGLFSGHSAGDLAQTLLRAYPLHPLALHALPRVAARLAQNERTVFAFVHSAALDRDTGLRELYDFFAPAMQTDSGVGGTYKRWLETEAALAKASNPAEEEIIAATALLTIGTGGERSRLKRNLLEQAGHGGTQVARRAIEALVRRRLLRYRKSSDDIAVTHGIDLDLTGALREEKARLDAGFDTIAALNEEQPPPVWYPHVHNVDRCLRRYFTSVCVAVPTLLEQGAEHEQLRLKLGEDGRMIYCLGGDRKTRGELEKLVTQLSRKQPRLAFVIPATEHSLKDLLLEAKALRELLADPKVTEEDPYVQPELENMLDAALGDLRRILARTLLPEGSNAWYLGGKRMLCRDEEELATALSELCEKVYKLTPRLNLETLVRQKPSPVMRNACKRLMLPVMNQADQPDLGMDVKSTSAHASIYRNLVRDKVYRKGNWLKPTAIKDEGLKVIWARYEDFFATPGKDKRPADLAAELASPPFGLRAGLFPLYFGIGLVAFGRCLTIKDSKGVYLPDVLGSDIEAICAQPDAYRVDVYKKPSGRYLEQLVEAFHGEPDASGDLLRQLYDALAQWRLQLPEGALKSRRGTEQQREFRNLVARPHDPAELAFEKFPAITGSNVVRDILAY